MSKRESVDPLPDVFSSYEEAAEFWDTHDTTDYPEAFAEQPFELQADIRRRRFEVEVEEELIGVLRERARQSGKSPKDRGTFTLGPEAEAALLASIEEADRGEVISGEELLRELQRD